MVPVSPERWDDLEHLFGRQGASNGCWCAYWDVGPGYAKRPRDTNRDELRRRVNGGTSLGLLAYAGDAVVGWCQLTPRAALSWLRGHSVLQTLPGGEGTVWSVSCFYVLPGSRRSGVMSSLIQAAVDAARSHGADILEAYPVDVGAPGATRNLFTGTRDAFSRAGFVQVGTLSRWRLIMRRDLHAV